MPVDVTRLESEMEFIRRRDSARRHHESPRCYGVSSDALAAFALGWGPRPLIPGRSVPGTRGHSWHGIECGIDYPRDASDLNACVLTYEMAPQHLQQRMLPVLEEFRGWVNERRNRYGEIPDESL